MTHKMLRRSSLRDIRGSFSRYFAIMAIIALGVGFFSGLRITTPAMLKTVGDFLDEKNFYDFRLLSAIGWEEDQVGEMKGETSARYVEGSYSADAVFVTDDGRELVMKLHSMPDKINGISLSEGRLPEASDECVADAGFTSGVKIGDRITVSLTSADSDGKSALKHREFVVVGTADSSLYINFERGNSSVGSGAVSGFIYLLPEAFDLEYYTEIYVKLDTDGEIYSDEYTGYIDEARPVWEDIAERSSGDRYSRLYGDAKGEIDEAKAELEEKKLDGRRELDDARAELDEAAIEIANGETELSDAENEIIRREKELSDAKAALDEGKATLESSAAQISDGENELEAAQSALDAAYADLSAGETAYSAVGIDPASVPELSAARAELVRRQAQIDAMRSALGSAKAEYEAGYAEYEKNLKIYDDGVSQIAGAKKKLSESAAELDDAKRKYSDGLAEYADAEKEYDEKIADAEEEIAEAEKELGEFSYPAVYLLDRSVNIGYSCLESDSGIVRQISRIFPVFFIAVAALVCMTTMGRMVEDSRTQIGVLKALGYGSASIMGKFIFYSGSAAAVGCVTGYALGTWLFPYVIWLPYELMYIPLRLKYVFSPALAAISLIVSLLCSAGVTYLSCRQETRETAAALMRPKAPAAGKRVFLENIGFIWNRLGFLRKVSVRNIFRYKKRFVMMILGVSGSTALLLTGLGLRDSISGFASMQYDDIQIADATVSYNPEDGGVPHELGEKLDELGVDYLPMYEGGFDLLYGSRVKAVNIQAPESFDRFGDFFIVKDEKGGDIALPGKDEAIVSVSIRDRYGVKVGDTITLRDSEMRELRLKVVGVFDNHVYNYVFMSFDTLKGQLGDSELNSAYMNYPDGSVHSRMFAEISEADGVRNISQLQVFKERVSNMMKSLDFVVLVVILSAAGLAFVVIYNLTNINITERVREIATIKVLGFFRREVSSYVMRENIVLTAMGAALGLVLGVFLHRFVISQIVIDLVSFRIYIAPVSYILAVILTFVFMFLVDLFMQIRLDRINMAESLKTVE